MWGFFMTQPSGQDFKSGSEFAKKMIGTPWSNRACTFNACDCWGLVVLYYRHVRGIEIHHSAGYEADKAFLTCYRDEVNFWKDINSPGDGDVFIGYEGAQPAHIGLIVDGRALHSRGENGAVRSDRLSAIERAFTKVEYKRYAAD